MQGKYGDEELDQPDPPLPPQQQRTHMGARILLVEDYDKTRLMIAHLLRRAGYQVTPAAQGESAINLLQSEQFDLVLADILMEDVDGIEVLHVAKQQSYNPQVILLTGCGTLETCMAALRYGAYDYLLKPCTEEDLLQCIEAALNKYTAEKQIKQAIHTLSTAFICDLPVSSMDDPDQAELSRLPRSASNASPRHSPQRPPSDKQIIGSLVLGTTRHKVWFKGKLLQITPTEHALLSFLAETPGEPRPYSDIVWHTHQLKVSSTEAQNLLRPHVRNLRKKLDSLHLVNERGVGYKLVDPEL